MSLIEFGVVFFLFTGGFQVLSTQKGCLIDVRKLDPEPLVLSAQAPYEVLYPRINQDHIRFDAADKILIACPGSNLAAVHPNATYVTATCISGTKFLVHAVTMDFYQLKCTCRIWNTAKYTGKRCEAGGREISIGFRVSHAIYVRQITVCFDTIRQTPLYSAYNLTQSIGDHESGVPRPFFAEDQFYHIGGLHMSRLYARYAQRATVNRQLGLPDDSRRFIDNDQDRYLARGHLTARADFVYGFEENATFHYVNTAPQWQGFNGNNWEKIEEGVRNYAQKHNLALQVYTGVYGTCKLPHTETGELTELYFYIDPKTGAKSMPIPQLYWKLVYEPVRKLAIVLLGVNNLYGQSDEVIRDDVICDDISDQLDWLDWKREAIDWGYSYACTVDDFSRTVKFAPDLDVHGLLI